MSRPRPLPRPPCICIVTPALKAANSGNWHTAARWARFLRPQCVVRVSDHWDGGPCDLLIALHARRSAAAIDAFATAHPNAPTVLVLTGTDLYRDIEYDAASQRSLTLATRLVVLQERGIDALPKVHHAKAIIIYQSAPRLQPGQPRVRSFDVAVVGHLREVKDPTLAMRVLEFLPAGSRVRVLHAGAALEPTLGVQARQAMRREPRYRWLGEQSRAQARQLMRRSRLLLHPSKMEGGAQAVLEAVQAGTPVIASRISGNVGMLGSDYPGYFEPGDVAAAARLIARAEAEPRFLRSLQRACRQRAALFAPARERKALHSLVDNLLTPSIARDA